VVTNPVSCVAAVSGQLCWAITQGFSKEKDVQLFFGLIWCNTEFDVNREPNNGRGPVDFKVSYGAGDKSLIEFKLAKSTSLKRNLEKQVEIYEKANKTRTSVKVVVCYLPAHKVEQAIADHYVTLKLPTTFVADVRRLLEEALAGEQHSVAELHAALSRKLKELEAKEDRLLDLLADDALPKTKVKTKLRKIQAERNAAQASLANTGAELAIGAGVLLDALDLMSDPEASYIDESDAIRRTINETFYQRFYLDEQGVQASELNPPFEDFHEALTLTKKTPAASVATSRTTTTKQGPLTGALDRVQQDDRSCSLLALTLADILSGAGSSKTSLVELRGLEPLTPTLPVWCATSCAIAP
jgi:site-specific DNA recombinase